MLDVLVYDRRFDKVRGFAGAGEYGVRLRSERRTVASSYLDPSDVSTACMVKLLTARCMAGFHHLFFF